MKCNDVEAVPVCLTSAIDGEQFSAVAHYEYGKDQFGETILVSTRYTNVAGTIVYDPATIAGGNPGECPASQLDREQICYRTTNDPEIKSGWARHDDDFVGITGTNVTGAGIQFFDWMGIPLDIGQAGFEVVPCAPEETEQTVQFDTESVCYRTTANPVVATGWARHDAEYIGVVAPHVSANGIAFFDSTGNPLSIQQAGFEFVPCAPEAVDPVEAAEQFDTESYCYVTTANPTPSSGWARHQDSFVGNPNNFPNISPAGIAYFDGVGNPVNISEPGFEVVPCSVPEPEVVPSVYQTTVEDVAPSGTLTITPGTDLVSWEVRNREANVGTSTVQVNGGASLVLDGRETMASGSIEEELGTLNDTVVITADATQTIRVMQVRRS